MRFCDALDPNCRCSIPPLPLLMQNQRRFSRCAHNFAMALRGSRAHPEGSGEQSRADSRAGVLGWEGAAPPGTPWEDWERLTDCNSEPKRARATRTPAPRLLTRFDMLDASVCACMRAHVHLHACMGPSKHSKSD